MSTVGTRLKELREQAGLTQDHISNIICKSKETVCKYELGQRHPNMQTIELLAKFYNVSTYYITGKDESVEEPDVSVSHAKIYMELAKYEPYFKSPSFIRYIDFAVKIKESGLGLEGIEKVFDEMIEFKNNIIANIENKT